MRAIQMCPLAYGAYHNSIALGSRTCRIYNRNYLCILPQSIGERYLSHSFLFSAPFVMRSTLGGRDRFHSHRRGLLALSRTAVRFPPIGSMLWGANRVVVCPYIVYRLIPINHYGLFYHLANTSTPQTIAFSDRVDQALHDASLQTVLHRATIRFIGNRSGAIGALQDQNGHIAACRHLLLRKSRFRPDRPVW